MPPVWPCNDTVFSNIVPALSQVGFPVWQNTSVIIFLWSACHQWVLQEKSELLNLYLSVVHKMSLLLLHAHLHVCEFHGSTAALPHKHMQGTHHGSGLREVNDLPVLRCSVCTIFVTKWDAPGWRIYYNAEGLLNDRYGLLGCPQLWCLAPFVVQGNCGTTLTPYNGHTVPQQSDPGCLLLTVLAKQDLFLSLETSPELIYLQFDSVLFWFFF